jgi:hypothetical protein
VRLCAALFLLPIPYADAAAFEVGSRFPAELNEKIIIKNEGGVRNATNSFAFGDTCYSSDHLTTWFIVNRILGNQVLLELECIPTVFGTACPNGTQTNMSLAQARARLHTHTREIDSEFMRRLHRFETESRPFLCIKRRLNAMASHP